MVRKKMIAENTSALIPLPQEYIGKELEIIIFSKEEITEQRVQDEPDSRTDPACKTHYPEFLRKNNSSAGLTILNLYI